MSLSKVKIIQKPPEELIAKFEEEELMRTIFIKDKVDVGVSIIEIVKENLPKLLEELNVKYDKIEVYPSAHPTWKSDIMVYREGKVILRISMKTCEHVDRIIDTIYRLKTSIRDGEHGLLNVAAGYKRTAEESEKLGFLMIFMSNDYIRSRTPEQIYQEIISQINEIKTKERLYSLRLANARDMYIVDSWINTMRLVVIQRLILANQEKIIDNQREMLKNQREMLRNQKKMLDNQQTMILILKEMLSELKAIRKILEKTT